MRKIVALAGLMLAAGPASAADPPSFEATYDLRLTHASSTTGPRAAAGTYDVRVAQTCDGWDTKTHVLLQLAFRDDTESRNERFFSSWEAKNGDTYRFAVRTEKNGKTVEAFKGTAALNKKGGRARYEIPPPEGRTKPRIVELKLPRDTLFPAAHSRALLARAEGGDALFRSVVLNGAASNGPRLMSTAIGPRVENPAQPFPAEIDRSLLGTPSWRMSAAFFNLNEQRDTPNTEMFLQLYGSGVTQSFEQTFKDFAVSATLKRLRRIAAPHCN